MSLAVIVMKVGFNFNSIAIGSYLSKSMLVVAWPQNHQHKHTTCGGWAYRGGDFFVEHQQVHKKEL